MILKPFKAEDYFELDLEPNTGFDVCIEKKDLPSMLLLLEDLKMSRSLWFDDKLYAIFGVIEIRLGVGEVFFIPTKGWEKKKFSVCKFVKHDLNAISKLFFRIQMSCLENEKFSNFAIFFLGFKKEGVLRHFDKFGRDYSMMSIIGGLI